MVTKIFYIDRLSHFATRIFNALYDYLEENNNYKITFVGPKKTNSRTWMSYHPTRNSQNIWQFDHYVRTLFRFIKIEKPNIVHFSFEWRSFGNVFSALKLPVLLFLIKTFTPSKIILELRAPLIIKDGLKWKIMSDVIQKNIPSIFLSSFLKVFIKIICSLSHQIIVNNPGNKNGLVEFYGIKNNKIKVIKMIVPLNNTNKPSDHKTKFETQFSRKKIVLFFGAISPRKSYETVIKAFSDISQKIPNHVLIIAGLTVPEFKQYEEMLRFFVKELNLEKKVIFTGYLEDEEIEVLFKIAEIALYIYRPYPDSTAALFFAIHHNKPCIVTDSETFREILSAQDAIFVEYNNKKQISDAILTLANNEDVRTRLEERMKNVSKKYSVLTTAQEYLTLYENVIQA